MKMNKSVFFVAVALICALIMQQAHSMNDRPANAAFSRSYIKTLIINADVTVVLVNSDKISVEANGNTMFMDQVQVERSGDTVLINASKRKDYTGKGVIYVSATQLRNIRINSSANVKTLNVLQLPKLDVVINGDCKVAVSNTGVTNLIETSNFSVEQTKQVREWPSNVLLAGNDLP
jgi:hypothetical protein